MKHDTNRKVLDGLIPVCENVLIRNMLTDVAFRVKLLLFAFILKVTYSWSTKVFSVLVVVRRYVEFRQN
jgi:uncharacterized membrane protein